MSNETQLYSLALQQGGAFSRAQALACLTDDQMRYRLLSGAWALAGPGVYSLPTVPDSWRRRLWIAHLVAGAESAVSHESAAEIHEYEGIVRGLVVLTAPHPHHHRVAGATVHQLTDVRPEWIATVDGLPVTDPARTIVDLAAVVNYQRLFHCTHHAAISRRVDLDQVAMILGQLARRGKRGMHKLGTVLDRLGPGEAIPASTLEVALYMALAAGGLPDPVRQYAHPGRQFTKGCVDCAYIDAKLIIEVDGRRWHSRINDIKRDRERDNDAARAGWQTLRFLYEHVRSDAEGMCATIHDVRAVRLAA